MGQYYAVYNTTKKQVLHASGLNCGAKLMEQVGIDKCPATALFMLLAIGNGRGGGDAKNNELVGYWAGDSIVIQGDYAERTDNGFIGNTQDFNDITTAVRAMLNAEFADA